MTVADSIFRGFVEYRQEFEQITQGAAGRFLEARWVDMQAAAEERLHLYNRMKFEVCERIGASRPGLADWSDIRREYARLLTGRRDIDLAGTFFNSVYRQLADREQLDDEHAFVSSDPDCEWGSSESFLVEYSQDSVEELLKTALQRTEFGGHLANTASNFAQAAQKLTSELPLLRDYRSLRLELIDAIFYRNKGAYLVGQLVVDDQQIPLALACCQSESGVCLDAVLWGEARLSVIFSFTRAYFMVDNRAPAQLVDYLQGLMPIKKRSELFASLGLYKQGKTEFVRGYRDHLLSSTDQFEIAEGIKGQVMCVFVLTSYQIVFKVMKDEFPATKHVNHQDVRDAYQLVKAHDRVGRMADTQEFHQFSFPKDRLAPDLLNELLRVAGERVQLSGDQVLISHLYTERLMEPLNLYLQRCSEHQRIQVLEDYGRAIKQLAAANIFPGDMLLKNFGVTRHGRVVFYDYDEICYLTDVQFRQMPKSDTSTNNDWIDVGEYDVFPEEFSNFLFPDDRVLAIFNRHHDDLFTVEGWQQIQAQVQSDQLLDVYPYPERERLL